MINYESCKLNSEYGRFDFYCFNWGKHEDENILCFVNPYYKDTPYVRIQSACFTAEIFRSLDCDCHEQLDYSMKLVNDNGGYFIYLLRDGRGAGIFEKTKGMKLSQDKGFDTAESYEHLGLEPDPRRYDKVIEILHYFELSKIKLLTNNPRKIDNIKNSGIEVIREPIEIEPTEDSLPYLTAKKNKLGHMFSKYF